MGRKLEGSRVLVRSITSAVGYSNYNFGLLVYYNLLWDAASGLSTDFPKQHFVKDVNQYYLKHLTYYTSNHFIRDNKVVHSLRRSSRSLDSNT